jgi:hypothetical protein
MARDVVSHLSEHDVRKTQTPSEATREDVDDNFFSYSESSGL